MFRNYLKTALRNIMKRKGYSLLNIAGLTIGITCCLLIFHYVSYEKSYDRFNPEAGQIVRVRLDEYQQGKLAWKSATSYPAIGPTMKKDYPEVVNFCRLLDAEGLFTNETTHVKFNENKGYYADPSSLDMLNVLLVAGNKANVLNAPDKMVMSQSMAKKYFGVEDPLGKRLTAYLNGKSRIVEVAGIMKDYPVNSHLDIKYLISYVTRGEINKLYGDKENSVETSFNWYDFYTYLQLRPGADLQQLQKKLPAFCKKYIDVDDRGQTASYHSELHLIPLTDIHLYSNVNQEAEVNGNGQTVGFLFLVAIFIIGIAWINYINLATARSVERAREVGVRKVMGARRSHLIKQFLTESFLLNLSAMLLSIILYFLLQPSFDHFVGSPSTSMSLTEFYWGLFTLLFLAGTVLSGLYPAFVLSGFQPITVLKGLFRNSTQGQLLRKGLIIVQFMTSVVLIAGTIIVYQQVSYMQKEKLGANIDQTIILEGPSSVADSLYQNNFQPFKSAVIQQHTVKSVSASSNVMGQEIYWCSTFRRLNAPDNTQSTIFIMGIDDEFIPAYNLQMAAGRNFSKDFGTDKKAIILNERAVNLLGFESPEAALGGKVPWGDTMTVVGVIKDYHHQGLQKTIEPLLMSYRPNQRTYYSMKVSTDNLPSTINQLEKTWNNYFPSDPFSYTFLDESFAQQYKADILFGKVFGVFALLAILIACFGLLGLSAYNVLQRTKEIGVRKILGASSQNILMLLSRDFLKLVIIAFVCSIPLCWYIMHHWLQDFAYRINITWWVFILAGFLALLIAWATIVLQSLRAVTENPVKNLRTE